MAIGDLQRALKAPQGATLRMLVEALQLAPRSASSHASTYAGMGEVAKRLAGRGRP